MTFVVPFDGSELAEAALIRAVEFATVLDDHVVAVAVIPGGNVEYARDKGWIGPHESFDRANVVDHLTAQVAELAPDAELHVETVDRYAPRGTIAKRIRRVAWDLDASMVFLGSENAGRMVTSVSSVAGNVASDDAYDVVIIRHKRPTTVPSVEAASPYHEENGEITFEM